MTLTFLPPRRLSPPFVPLLPLPVDRLPIFPMSTQEQDTASGGVDGGDNADSLRATYAGAKRRIANLEQQLKTMQEAGTKRKSYVNSLSLPDGLI